MREQAHEDETTKIPWRLNPKLHGEERKNMTKKQRREHKLGNQQRKDAILGKARTGDPALRYYWAHARVGQDSKYATRKATHA